MRPRRVEKFPQVSDSGGFDRSASTGILERGGWHAGDEAPVAVWPVIGASFPGLRMARASSTVGLPPDGCGDHPRLEGHRHATARRRCAEREEGSAETLARQAVLFITDAGSSEACWERLPRASADRRASSPSDDPAGPATTFFAASAMRSASACAPLTSMVWTSACPLWAAAFSPRLPDRTSSHRRARTPKSELDLDSRPTFVDSR